jgi:hypothetical protein
MATEALRKTRTVLTGTSFSDNTTGAITAQMVRQYVESAMGAYGCINNAAGDGVPANQAVAAGTTVTVDWSLGSSGSDVKDDTGTVSATTVGTDADFTNDRIRIYDKGIFVVNLALSLKQEAVATDINWTVMVSSANTGGATTDLPAIKAIQLLGNVIDAGNFSVNGIIDTTAHTTYTDVYARIKQDNVGSQNFKLHFGQLSVYRVG